MSAASLTEPAFVVSAGRTGTVFLTKTLPQHYPQLDAVHEPLGSRSTLMMANTRNLLGVGTPLVKAKMVRELRQRAAARPPGTIGVEVNPMLVSLTDVLADAVDDLRVVHMVRHPVTWTQSIRAFKASTKFRWFIDWAPLATPFPVPRPGGMATWLLGTDQITKALWRWTYSNERIEELDGVAKRFERIRYEDLFGGPSEARTQALTTLLDVLGLPWPDDEEALFGAERQNPAPDVERVTVPEDAMAEICGPLMEKYGYALDGSVLPQP